MRKDMGQRFLEAKSGNPYKYPRRNKEIGKLSIEDQPNLENMMHAHHIKKKYAQWDCGHWTGYAVMRRFLQSKVGQKWDEVYSEVCDNADYRTFKGHHVLQSIKNLVEQNCSIDEEGCPRDDRGFKVEAWRGGFYVHPETQTLEVTKVPRRKTKEVQQKVFEMDGINYFKHKGIWYRVEMQVLSQVRQPRGYSTYSSTLYQEDAFGTHQTRQGDVWKEYWSVPKELEKVYGYSPDYKIWYCTKKEQANSKEIKKLKKKFPTLLT